MQDLSKPIYDLSGKRFGRLLAISYIAGSPKKAWQCQCDCGKSVEVRGCNLRTGKTKSCGCLKMEVMAAGMNTVHGMASTPTYKSWDAMIGRCTNPSDPSFERYGGAGIAVCDAWRRFEHFFIDMGVRPTGTSLDRIDVHGSYGPDNCRWATAKVQANNRKNNRFFDYKGVKMTIRQICDATGANYSLMRGRITKLGWTVERSIAEPAQVKLTRS